MVKNLFASNIVSLLISVSIYPALSMDRQDNTEDISPKIHTNNYTPAVFQEPLTPPKDIENNSTNSSPRIISQQENLPPRKRKRSFNQNSDTTSDVKKNKTSPESLPINDIEVFSTSTIALGTAGNLPIQHFMESYIRSSKVDNDTVVEKKNNQNPLTNPESKKQETAIKDFIHEVQQKPREAPQLILEFLKSHMPAERKLLFLLFGQELHKGMPGAEKILTNLAQSPQSLERLLAVELIRWGLSNNIPNLGYSKLISLIQSDNPMEQEVVLRTLQRCLSLNLPTSYNIFRSLLTSSDNKAVSIAMKVFGHCLQKQNAGAYKLFLTMLASNDTQEVLWAENMFLQGFQQKEPWAQDMLSCLCDSPNIIHHKRIEAMLIKGFHGKQRWAHTIFNRLSGSGNIKEVNLIQNMLFEGVQQQMPWALDRMSAYSLSTSSYQNEFAGKIALRGLQQGTPWAHDMFNQWVHSDSNAEKNAAMTMLTKGLQLNLPWARETCIQLLTTNDFHIQSMVLQILNGGLNLDIPLAFQIITNFAESNNAQKKDIAVTVLTNGLQHSYKWAQEMIARFAASNNVSAQDVAMKSNAQMQPLNTFRFPQHGTSLGQINTTITSTPVYSYPYPAHQNVFVRTMPLYNSSPIGYPTPAFMELKATADAGNIEACLELARRYENGTEGFTDNAQALKYYKQAATLRVQQDARFSLEMKKT